MFILLKKKSFKENEFFVFFSSWSSKVLPFTYDFLKVTLWPGKKDLKTWNFLILVSWVQFILIHKWLFIKAEEISKTERKNQGGSFLGSYKCLSLHTSEHTIPWFIQDKILKALYMSASNCSPGHLITCGLWKLMGIFQHR